MQVGLAQCVNKGMQRDYSMDKASQEFAYENKNIRITTTGNNSFLSVTNERSTEEIRIHATIKCPYIINKVDNVIMFTSSNLYPNAIPEFNTPIKVYLKDGTKIDSTISGKRWPVDNIELSSTIIKVESLTDKYEFVESFESIPYDEFNLGTVLGSCVANNKLILFTKTEDSDNIYSCSIDTYTGYVKTLYSGNLGFNLNNPIECTFSYEADGVQKVYWVDGINQPRVINICNTYDSTESFDFVPSVNNNLNISIEKEYNGTGNFKSGIIQYYITAYKKFGSETNVVYQSPLYYISPSDRGGKVDETQTCSFKISITPSEDFNKNFDYVRVYSLIRTSLNGESQVQIIQNVPLNGTSTIQIIDTNTNTVSVAPTDIMFVGGNTIIASTIEQKDNTLFLGDITSKSIDFNIEDIKNKIASLRVDNSRNFTNKEDEKHLPDSILKFKWKVFGYNEEDLNNQYSYFNFLNKDSFTIKGFKHREIYRFGFQLQTKTGDWTQTIWLDDLVCDKYPKIEDEVNESEEYLMLTDISEDYSYYMFLPYIWFNPEYIFTEDLDLKDFTNYRLVMAESSLSDRSIVCQGYVVPTLYNTRLGNVTSWTTKFINEDNKHWENTLYLGENTEGNIVPTPKTELDLSLYKLEKDNNIELKGYNISPENYSDGWNLTQITINYKALYENTVSTITEFTFHFYNPDLGDKDITVYYGEDPNFRVFTTYSGFRSLVFYNRYEAYERAKKISSLAKYSTTISFEKNDYGFPIITSTTLESYLKEQLGTSNVINLTDYILKSSEEFPEVSKDEAKSSKNFSKSNLVSRKYDPSIVNRETEKRKNHYFIDASTCNLFVPNFDEVSTIVDNSNLKFRIVGKTDLTNNISSFELQSNNSIDGLNEDFKLNFEFFGNLNEERKTFGLQSYPLWSSFSRNSDTNFSRYNWTYLWNTNDLSKSGDGLSKITKKTFANVFYGSTTTYATTSSKILWEPQNNLKELKSITEDLTYFENSIYRKKVDDLMFPDNKNIYYMSEPYESNFQPYNYKDTKIHVATYPFESVKINYNSTNHILLKLDNYNSRITTLPGYENTLKDSTYNGNTYDIIGGTTLPLGEFNYTNRVFQDAYPDNDDYFTKNFSTIGSSYEGYYSYTGSAPLKNNDIVLYFYKSQYQVDSEGNPTGDFQFGTDGLLPFFKIGIFKESWGQYVPKNLVKFFEPRTLLPSESYVSGSIVIDKFKNIVIPIIENNDIIFNFHHSDITGNNAFDIYGKYQIVLKEYDVQDGDNIVKATYAVCEEYNPFNSNNLNVETDNSVWIAELYKDYNDYKPYGGTTENAIELNTFIPISFPTKLNTSCNGLEGDTYFQRWDSLRTYPEEDNKQSVVDVVSLMVETHANLDGRSDTTRGRTDVFNIRPENIQDTINNVYSQTNNYIISSVLDSKFDDSTHPTLYTWSLTKQALSEIDNWTKINLSRAQKLDGDKGVLTKIKRWNNQLLAFQEKGVAIINFNQQAVVGQSEGVPIEIAASGKVNGHYYISSTQGCKNKWSIIDSPYGIYFIDSYNKSINILNENIQSLTTLNLFEDWINQNEKGFIWNSVDYKGFKSFYDSIHKEIYFINDEFTLCYNELLQQFTSFYDYQKLNTMSVIDSHVYGIKNNTLHRMFEGEDYCNLFGEQKEYSITYKINKDPFVDKTWTNIEYRADVFDSGNIHNNPVKTLDTFNTLEVWNEYQYGIYNMFKSKPKFRIWRADIPRDIREGRGLNRIRNPWIMLKLSKTEDTNKRMEFHDLVIKYLQ